MGGFITRETKSNVSKGCYFFDYSKYFEFVEKSVLYTKVNDLYLVDLDRIYPLNSFFNESLVYVPVVNIQVCLHRLSQCIGGHSSLDEIEKMFKSISANTILIDDKRYIVHNYFQPLYGLYPGWISGMAQGLYISIAIRLYRLTLNEVYKDYAYQALSVMTDQVVAGGASVHVKGGIWFEEYPKVGTTSFVLNGNLFSIFALYDISEEFDDRALFDKSLVCLKYKLSEFFKFIGYSRYDLLGAMADGKYNDLHLNQLTILKEIMGVKNLEPFIEKLKLIPSSGTMPVSFRFKKNLARMTKLFNILLYVVNKK